MSNSADIYGETNNNNRDRNITISCAVITSTIISVEGLHFVVGNSFFDNSLLARWEVAVVGNKYGKLIYHKDKTVYLGARKPAGMHHISWMQNTMMIQWD